MLPLVPVPVFRLPPLLPHVNECEERVAGVVEGQVDYNSNAPAVAIGNESGKLLIGAQAGIDLHKGRGVIPVIALGLEDGVEVDYGNSQILQIVQVLAYTCDIPAIEGIPIGFAVGLEGTLLEPGNIIPVVDQMEILAVGLSRGRKFGDPVVVPFGEIRIVGPVTVGEALREYLVYYPLLDPIRGRESGNFGCIIPEEVEAARRCLTRPLAVENERPVTVGKPEVISEVSAFGACFIVVKGAVGVEVIHSHAIEILPGGRLTVLRPA